MFEFILYMIKVAALIGVFYMFYRLLLYRQSFHRLNRIVLMATALLSFVLPLCVITFHRTVVVKDASVTLDGSAVAGPAMPVDEALPVGERPWFLYAVGVNVVGVVLRLVLTAVRLYRLHRFIGEAEHQPTDDGITLAITEEPVAPFSWMNTIVLSRQDYQLHRTELLTHERAHIHLRHSWDVVTMELLTALQWFNPAIWMMRANLRAIHEYEADQAVLQSGVDVRRYVDLLIEKALASSGYSLANSIKDSTLKNRIVMMMKTNNRQSWPRALYILPIVAVSLTLSAKTETEVKNLSSNQPSAEATSTNSAESSIQQLPQQTELTAITDSAKTKVLMVNKDEKPLIIVDGVEVEDLANINPKLIATISVLKEKSGKEIYGERGKNGVLLITMKDEATEAAANKAYDVVDVMPQFPGGPGEMMKFISQNLRYPVQAMKADVEGRVICQFVVEKDGNINEVKVVNNSAKTKTKEINEAIAVENKAKALPAPTEEEVATGKQSLADEAVCLVKAMPKWTPGTQKGEPVRVKYTIPIKFALQ